jgi:hypothetical protein
VCWCRGLDTLAQLLLILRDQYISLDRIFTIAAALRVPRRPGCRQRHQPGHARDHVRARHDREVRASHRARQTRGRRDDRRQARMPLRRPPGMASLANMSLTSVDQDGATMGRTAGRLLLERIKGRTASVRFSVNPTLVPAARPVHRPFPEVDFRMTAGPVSLGRPVREVVRGKEESGRCWSSGLIVSGSRSTFRARANSHAPRARTPHRRSGCGNVVL